jgi:hypothetical protein
MLLEEVGGGGVAVGAGAWVGEMTTAVRVAVGVGTMVAVAVAVGTGGAGVEVRDPVAPRFRVSIAKSEVGPVAPVRLNTTEVILDPL